MRLCKRKIERLFGAPVPSSTYYIRTYGIWYPAEVSGEDLLRTLLGQLHNKDITPVAARYIRKSDGVDPGDPLMQRGFSAVKLYYKENNYSKKSMEEGV